MKVYNLCCEQGHRFEGWFASEEEFAGQAAQLLIECPACSSNTIRKLPSAPRLNLSGASAPSPEQDAEARRQTQLLAIARHIVANTEDVGENFAEEARRIHYRENPARGIRGIATAEECDALLEEGIDVVPFPFPDVVKQTLQ